MSRIILVTGATSGIGLETARVLSRDTRNTVVIASRSKDKVDRTVVELSKEGSSNVRGMVLDLGSLKNVGDFVAVFKKQFASLDVLLCNAGITGPFSHTTTEDGFETTFATNHLGHLLLTDLFLGGDAAFVPSRLVIVSSGTHDPDSHSGMPAPSYTTVEDWSHPTKYDSSIAYTSSKLANAMTGRYFGRHLDPSKTTVAVYDPGFIGTTGLLRATGALQPVIKAIVESLIAFLSWWHGTYNQNSTLSRSSPFLAKLCTDPELVRETGEYYVIDFKHHVSKQADVVSAQEELVEESRSLLRQKGFLDQ